ncbi:hypothetical protein OROGR_004867 [Orobanche gracilis]
MTRRRRLVNQDLSPPPSARGLVVAADHCTRRRRRRRPLHQTSSSSPTTASSVAAANCLSPRRRPVPFPHSALVNALGAIILGAPVGIQHFKKTVHWSLLMSLFTFAPAASVYGSSWTDWHRIFAHTKPVGSTDFMICLPAHGAVIGAWFGAWPMPLDWERPWQEWPVCVTYGAILGYLVGMVVSFGFIVFNIRRHHGKGD